MQDNSFLINSNTIITLVVLEVGVGLDCEILENENLTNLELSIEFGSLIVEEGNGGFITIAVNHIHGEELTWFFLLEGFQISLFGDSCLEGLITAIRS